MIVVIDAVLVSGLLGAFNGVERRVRGAGSQLLICGSIEFGNATDEHRHTDESSVSGRLSKLASLILLIFAKWLLSTPRRDNRGGLPARVRRRPTFRRGYETARCVDRGPSGMFFRLRSSTAPGAPVLVLSHSAVSATRSWCAWISS